MLLQYMRDVDDEVFKEYSNGNNFNSFINEFKKKIRENINHDIEMAENSEYISKLFDIVNFCWLFFG